MHSPSGEKTRVSSQELGQGLWMFCKKFSTGVYPELKQEMEKAGFRLSQEQEIEFSRQIIIANLWIMSKALAPDKKALDELHHIYFSGHRNFIEGEEEKERLVRFAQDELLERYKKYYELWNDASGDQIMLAGSMLEYMVNNGKPDRRLLNALLIFNLNAHLMAMMKAVLDFRSEFEVTDP